MSTPHSGPFGRVTLRLVLLAVVPLVVIAVSLFVVSRAEIVPLARQRVLTDLSIANSGTHALIENWVQEQRRAVRYISANAAAVPWDPAELRIRAQRATEMFPGLGAVVFAAPDGTVVADALSEADGWVGDRAYFRAALQGESVVSKVIHVRTTAKPLIIIAEPVRTAPNEVAGVVFASLDPDVLAALVEPDTQTETGAFNTYLLDHTNRLICGSSAGTVVDADVLPSDDPSQPYVGRDGRTSYGVIREIDNLNWRVVTEIPATEVARIPHQYTTALIQTVAVGIVIALFVALFIGRSIQIPLAQLERVAQQISVGECDEVTDAPALSRHAPRELRTLRDTFVEMADTIARRRRELEHGNHLLRATQRMAHLGSWELDPTGRSITCSEEAIRVFGFSDTSTRVPVGNALSMMPREDRIAVMRTYVRSVRDGTNGFEMEHRIVPHGGGDERFVHLRCIHVRGRDGTLQRTMGMVHDITERHQFVESLHSALQEKTALLQEVQHRVRNNLSVIRSLLALKRDGFEDDSPAYDALNDTYNRITSMALMHDHLYGRDEFDHVDLAEYIDDLVTEIRSSYRRPGITVETRLEPYLVDVTTGIPCGMILNELVVNASKHAFPDGTGTITVSLTRLPNGQAELIVADDGIGMDSLEAASAGLGSELVRQLTDQIGGTIHITTNAGVHTTLRFAG